MLPALRGVRQGHTAQVCLRRLQTWCPTPPDPRGSATQPLHGCTEQSCAAAPLSRERSGWLTPCPADVSPLPVGWPMSPRVIPGAQVSDVHLRVEVTQTTDTALGKKFNLLHCLDLTVTHGFCHEAKTRSPMTTRLQSPCAPVMSWLSATPESRPLGKMWKPHSLCPSLHRHCGCQDQDGKQAPSAPRHPLQRGKPPDIEKCHRFCSTASRLRTRHGCAAVKSAMEFT